MAIPRPIKTEAQIKRDYLAQMSDEQLQCRGQHRHRWPSDEISPKQTRLPKNMTSELRNGMFTITESCLRDCGRWRRFTTLSGGLFDLDTVYSYWSTKDSGWVTVTEDSGVEFRPREFKREAFRRSLPLIEASSVHADDEPGKPVIRSAR